MKKYTDLELKKIAKDLIDNFKSIEALTHQGILDITDVINFHEIASEHNLTEKQYEKIIEFAQNYGNEKLAKEKGRITTKCSDCNGSGKIHYKLYSVCCKKCNCTGKV